MKWIDLAIAGLVGLATSAGLILAILKANRHYGLAGRAPEAHHTHSVPISRLGGMALAGAMVAVALVFCLFSEPCFLKQNYRWLVLVCSLGMFGLGLWDDLSALGAKRKLFGQILIASFAYSYGISIDQFKLPFTYEVINLGLWAWPVTVLWLVALTNLINLIDGVDGVAGGISLMLMILLTYVHLQSSMLPVITAGMVGALLGFLRFNYPPARIYMGDGGAYFLGFYIGCSTIVTSHKGTVVAALIAPLFVLALPIIDTSTAIIRRGIKGLPLFRADRKHIHHQLLAAGHSRHKVVLGFYLFTAFFLLLGFTTFYWRGQFFPLFLGVGALAVILAAGSFNFSREWFSVGRMLENSREAREEIQYAMHLTRWLALEGKRAETFEELAEDVVFVARKLGFTNVRISFKAEAKTWPLADQSTVCCLAYRQALPGHPDCLLELGTGCPSSKKSPNKDVCKKCEAGYEVLADLLTEGWVKAMGSWLANDNKLPSHLNPCPINLPSQGKPESLDAGQ